MTGIGDQIKSIREVRAWSQTDVARRMNDHGWPKYSQVTVARTESGERMPRLDEAFDLADVFGVNIYFLAGEVNAIRTDEWAAGFAAGRADTLGSVRDLLDGLGADQ